MADPDLTPEALKRLVERLSNITPRDSGYAFLGHEAAAAISALTAERDARDGEIAAAVECCKDYAAAREQAEARLQEIEAEMRAWRKDPRMDWPRNQIGRILSRSTSQGGEG